MPQTITPEHRQFGPRHDLGTNVEIAAPAQGDFARGQRHAIAVAHVHGDFATGMRATSVPRVTGDFATGMRSAPRTTTLGDFATGMRTRSAAVVTNRFTNPDSALPIAA